MAAGTGRLLLRWRERVCAVRPTRDGAWCIVVAVGLGVAAVNTGNNLAYLLCSMLLGIIMVSGMFSDLTLRGLRLEVDPPAAIHAGRPALVSLVLVNEKRWLASHSVAVEALGAPRPQRLTYVARLGPGERRLVPWMLGSLARGRHPLPAVRVTTRFPFGLFVKARPARPAGELLVYPALGPLPAASLREAGGPGARASPRGGRGHELRGLRPYRPGDEPRLIHWPTTARAGEPIVRELEPEGARDARLVLVGSGARNPVRRERALSEAASLAVRLLGAGAAVELRGRGVRVAPGRDAGQARRILRALALFEPGGAWPVTAGDGPPVPGGLPEIRISLDGPS